MARTVDHLSEVLDDWCRRVGRNPAEIERTLLVFPEGHAQWREYVDAGFRHLILVALAPFDLSAARRLLEEIRTAKARPG